MADAPHIEGTGGGAAPASAAAGGEGMRAVVGELAARFPDVTLTEQPTADGIPTLWLGAERAAPGAALTSRTRRRGPTARCAT